MDLIEIEYSEKTYQGGVSFRKLANFINKYGHQRAFFENGFRILLSALMNLIEIEYTERTFQMVISFGKLACCINKCSR